MTFKTIMQAISNSANKITWVQLTIHSFLLLLISATDLHAQDSSLKAKNNYPNSIKLNITSGILYDNSLQLGYERILNNGKQSIGIFGGYNEFPINLNFNFDNTAFTGTKNRSGYSIGADYRFYLRSENKFQPPHGLFLAPFISYYHFSSERLLTYTGEQEPQTAQLNTNLNFINIGGELGYQFVLWKRFVIDAVMFGPAITRYSFNAKLDGQITGIDENEMLSQVIDAMKQKFPLLDELSGNSEVSSNGTENFWSAGFRYNVSVGFRF
jgi:hypothetical protein